ncbi:hypothetical protein ACFYUJ_29560 [Streptomyces sp. NPDC004520]|uniref:hypothetical protein n=1 Tax=Streptomyces sp. NPDC004520 TaxID=3364702 RepID=UPI00369B3D2F
MKRCAYCEHLLIGEAVEIATDSANGARPSAYWHKTLTDCIAAETRATGDSPLQRRLSRS